MKKIVLPILIAVTSYGSNLNYAVLDKHSLVLPENKIQVRASYLKVNDTIDFLDIKESELGDNYADSFGSIGDMDGYDFNLRYGLSSKDSIFLNYQRWNVDYGDSTLNNNKIDIYNRFNIYKTISFDIGFTQDKANPITIKSDIMLNSMINKIKPNSGIKIENGSIIQSDGSITTLIENGKEVAPYISIEDLESNSYYTRLLFGYSIAKNSFLDFYLGYKFNDIKTDISIYPKNNEDFNKEISDLNIPNLNRTETVGTLGISYTFQLKKSIYEFNYEYNKIFRDDDLSYVNQSHILNITVAKEITNQFLLYVGGKVMFEQFNTDLPYLYNKYTQTQFDKKYGFAKVGIVYSF